MSSIEDEALTEVELVPENEKIENEKGEGPQFHCDLYDVEMVHKIAEAFIPGLASACVDNTTGGLFSTPGSVASDIRKEMVDYLTQRSEAFVAESIILEGAPDSEVSDHPYDIISDFVDDFASSKRNFFSRVSGWLLSESREDKIDDFAQEMEINGFWLMDRRESIAHILLKNVDFKNAFHCDRKFKTTEELAEHVVVCDFRSVNCKNEGCAAMFSARHAEHHDSDCAFKIIPCEQKCPANIMRREMDRHCITVCPMKTVSCPFYTVGCQSTVPYCKIAEHRSDEVLTHVQYVLKSIHKGESEDCVKQQADRMIQSFAGELSEAKDVRSLTFKVKDIEARIGPLQVITKSAGLESKDIPKNITEESTAESVVIESKDVPKNITEESTIESAGIESNNVPNNITEESTIESVGIESNDGPKNITEESIAKSTGVESNDVPKNITEESTTESAGIESNVIPKNITEESTTESTAVESNDVPKNITEESTTKSAGIESNDVPKNFTEESTLAASNSIAESNNGDKADKKLSQAVNNVSEELAENLKLDGAESQAQT